MWITQGDIILLGLREYQDAKADVIMKYTAEEARNLQKYGEIPESVKVNETTEADDANEDIIFGSDSELDDIDEVSVSVLDGVRESCCALSDCKRDEGGRCV